MVTCKFPFIGPLTVELTLFFSLAVDNIQPNSWFTFSWGLTVEKFPCSSLNGLNLCHRLINQRANIAFNVCSVGHCIFSSPQTGAVFLAPHAGSRLALIISGNSIEGIRDAVHLATPTIPPMTRSPFSNMVPDYVITGPLFRARGPGGYLCAGFWDNRWAYGREISSCVCWVRIKCVLNSQRAAWMWINRDRSKNKNSYWWNNRN